MHARAQNPTNAPSFVMVYAALAFLLETDVHIALGILYVTISSNPQ